GDLENANAASHQSAILQVELLHLLGEVDVSASMVGVVGANEFGGEAVCERDEVTARAVQRIDEGSRFTNQRPTFGRPTARRVMAVIVQTAEVDDLELLDDGRQRGFVTAQERHRR